MLNTKIIKSYMGSFNLKKVLCVVSVALLFASNAQAALFTQSLDFNANNQSIWGAGGSVVGFDYSDNLSVDIPLGLGSVSVGYRVGASSGSTTVGYDGQMSVDYTDTLAAPGVATLSLGYGGQLNGGSFATSLGAYAQLTSSLGNYGPDFSLNANRTFIPQLGTAVTASASKADVIKAPIIDILVADAGVQLGVSQDSRFVANALDGTLLYSLQGSTDVFSTAFSIGNAGIDLDVDLAESGIWDFWFADQTLDNTFSTSFDLDLSVYASTVLGCGTLGLSSCSASTDLLSLNVYDVNPFALGFNRITNLDGFSIQVSDMVAAVPEASSLALLGIGILGLAGVRRRKTV